MTARVYIHPRHPEGLAELCARYRALGYTLSNTRRGFIEARAVPVLRNVVHISIRRKDQ